MKRFRGFILLILVLVFSLSPVRAASIVREVWLDIPGNDIGALTSNPRYPNQPSFTNLVTSYFEAPTEFAENYGQRMHGYIIPPVTGNYIFWIATDDNGQLWLSLDENPSNVQMIASVNTWTSSREWGKEPNQQSAPIHLEAGKPYYISALQKEGGGGDNLAVRWLRPDGVDEAPISATNLYPYGIAFTPPKIQKQPANTTAVEGSIAQFTITLDPLSIGDVQWKKNGTPIPNGTGSTLNFGPVTMDDNQAKFSATIVNRLGSTNTTEATLTVTPDVTRPTLVSALNLGLTSVRIIFSEPVDPATATTANNYKINNGITVSSAVMGADNKTVMLTTTTLTYGVPYVITVNGVKDRAAAPNTVALNSTVEFVAVEFAPVDIGSTGGATIPVQGGFDVIGGGKDIGGTSDQFQFGYQERTGDFDLKVRVDGLSISDPWVQAGFMARESLAANSRFAGIFSSSPLLGTIFEYRSATGGNTEMRAPTGGFPANYPNNYLRLRRSGTTLTGFASFDGESWQQIGSISLSGLPSRIYVGMAVSSHNNSQNATARFRDIGPVVNPKVFTYTPTTEPLGPSNRRTGLIFSEIMYNPRARTDTNDLEFIEIFNAESVLVDMSGWKLDGGIQFTFPEGFKLQAGDFVVIAADPGAMARVYGYTGALGPYSGRLSNSGDTVILLNRAGATRLEVTYNNKAPWPVAADGAGHSLVLSRPSYGEDDVRAWGASAKIDGSPGMVEPILANPWQTVVINEFLAHTDDPSVDFIELYNAGNSPVDISGCYLTDDVRTNKYRIADGTMLPARGFRSFDQNELGFSLSAAGETIYLVSADLSRVLDAIQFDGQENGVSTGRAPDGSPTMRRLKTPTPAQANSARRVEDVVINEIMYHPISNDDREQYVELYNRSAVAVDLTDWQFVSGIDYKFPPGANIPAGGYVVVAKDAARLIASYPQLNSNNTFGDYGGRLSSSGERLALAKMDTTVSTNEFGAAITNQIFITISEVTYVDGGRWSDLADGGGSSLELIDSHSDLPQASNWAASDETQKAPWTTVQVTARLELGNGQYPIDRLYLSMLGAGEALVDDVEVFKSNGANLLGNPGFESGQSGWSFFGQHKSSTIDTSGAFSGNRVLHLKTPGDGDTGPNTIRANLSAPLASTDTVTIRAKVRWLSGWPEMLFRVRGNWIELPARMTVPANLGTPGQVNSRAVSNAGPAIYDVAHSPALPRANQSVIVTARVSDPDGVPAPRVRWRLDGSATAGTVTMRDDGLGGDALAGDGLWTATLPGRGGGNLVAFRIEASDDASPTVTSQFPADAPARECHIRWDDPVPFGTFAHYHLWNTSPTESAFGSSPGLDNTYRDATLVYGQSRIIYNAGFRNKGSPFHSGYGDYAVTVPKDDLLLGVDDRVLGSTGNGGSEGTGMKTDVAGWIGEQLGIPFLHSHYIRFYRNGGLQREVSLDMEQPNRDMAKSWFGGGGVRDNLYKIAVWFEFADDNSGFAATGATLERFPGSGALKPARYRWNWQIRPGGDTATDFDPIFDLVTAANSSTEQTRRLPQIADMEEWMRVFAYHRILGNWDSYAFNVGQNMYLYTPLGGQARLMPWDIDFVLGEGGGATESLWGGQDPVMNNIFNIPMYRRMLWRAYQDAINGPLQPDQYEPQIEGRRTALANNGVQLADPGSIRTYIEGRREFIRQQLESADTKNFAITSNNGNDFTTANGVVTLSGTAPFAVASIEINGVPYPVRWLDFTAWQVSVPLGGASNLLRVTGKDLRGNPVGGAEDTITVGYTGAVPQIQDWVVFNEIMYNSLAPNADFIEIYNPHPSFTFDLSGVELSGVDYVFPAGTFIPANSYIVVAEDKAAFGAAYGATIPVLGPWGGNLQNGGETLRLVKAQQNNTPDLVIDEVRYDSAAPWPAEADGLGSSLQLKDPARDNWRVGNWGVISPTDVANRATPGRSNFTRSFLDPFPEIWINEVLPANATGLQDNHGGREPWIELFNAGGSTVDLSGLFLSDDASDLSKWQIPGGVTLPAGQFLLVWADGEGDESAPGFLHTNFKLNPTNGIVLLSRAQGGSPAVMDFVNYAVTFADNSYGSHPDGDPRRRRLLYFPTPGAANNPAVPSSQIYINEWMAKNGSVLRDPADSQFEDWIEIYNAGTNTLDLGGYYLTDSQAKPTQFQIPVGVSIPPGGFRIFWADGEPQQNGPGRDVHLNFSLKDEGEEIALYTPDEQLVDLVTFGPQLPNISSGRFPDGADAPYLPFTLPSPGQPNISETGNQPPSLAITPDLSLNEGETATAQVEGSDPDEDQVLTYSIVTGPEGAAINPQTGAFSWVTSEIHGPGIYTITVRATDNGTPARFATRSFKITVAEVNQAPVIDPIPEVTIDEGSLYSFVVPGRDPDLPGQNLIYSLEPGMPAGAAIDSATGEFTWSPAENQGPATYDIVVKVSDGGDPALSSMTTFRIHVREIDNAPEITAVPPQSVREGELLQVQIIARDPDSIANPLTYSIVTAPLGVAIHPTTGLVTWTPGEEQGPRDHTITIRASEPSGGPSSTISFLVGVSEVNTAPTLLAIADVVANPGDRIVITNTATDADLPAQPLTFTAPTGLPEGASLDTQTGLFTWQLSDDPQIGTNTITIRVTDAEQPPLSAERTFRIVVRGAYRIAINEILHKPVTANTEFVELANYSAVNKVDLGNWRLEGYDFTLPAGTVLEPGEFVCVAKNVSAFKSAFGNTIPVAGNATVSLPASGGTIRLLRPRGENLPDEVVDEVQFAMQSPWPAAAITQGASLQLIDPVEDHHRPANWGSSAGSTTNPPIIVQPMTGTWRYFQSAPSSSWKELSFADASWPSGKGLFYVEDASLPAPKSTPLTIGQTTYYFRMKFNFTGNTNGARLVLNTIIDDGAVFYLNGNEVYRLGMPAGAIAHETFSSRLAGNAVFEGPFNVAATGLKTGENVVAVEVHQANAGSTDLVFGSAVDLLTLTPSKFTPGAPNSIAADLPAFADVWINEVLPNNTAGISDNAGEREPWIELYNGGNTTATLDGWFLSDSYSALNKWAFPAGTTIPAKGYLIIWADGEAAESSSGNLHANFRLASQSGSVVLSRSQSGIPAVVDSLDYNAAAANVSYGNIQDGNPGNRGPLPSGTPGGANANTPAAPPSLQFGLNAQGSLNISWMTEAGRGYRLEYSETLPANEWQSLDQSAGDGGAHSYADPVSHSTRFYRVVVE